MLCVKFQHIKDVSISDFMRIYLETNSKDEYFKHLVKGVLVSHFGVAS